MKVEEIVEVMKMGQMLRRFTSRGRPRENTIKIDSTETRIFWTQSGGERTGFRLREASSVVRGRQTKTFQKHRKSSTMSSRICSFSVVMKDGRSLDIECDTKEQANLWVEGLEYLIPRSKKRLQHFDPLEKTRRKSSLSVGSQTIRLGWLESRKANRIGKYRKSFWVLSGGGEMSKYSVAVKTVDLARVIDTLDFSYIRRIESGGDDGIKKPFPFHVKTKYVTYYFAAPDARSQGEWIRAIQSIRRITSPTSPTFSDAGSYSGSYPGSLSGSFATFEDSRSSLSRSSTDSTAPMLPQSKSSDGLPPAFIRDESESSTTVGGATPRNTDGTGKTHIEMALQTSSSRVSTTQTSAIKSQKKRSTTNEVPETQTTAPQPQTPIDKIADKTTTDKTTTDMATTDKPTTDITKKPAAETLEAELLSTWKCFWCQSRNPHGEMICKSCYNTKLPVYEKHLKTSGTDTDYAPMPDSKPAGCFSFFRYRCQ